MAEPQETSPTTESTQVWDEQQYEKALAHLEQLREQLDALRSIIPQMTRPLLQQRKESKAQMFAEIKASATQSTKGLRAFCHEWTSEQTQSLLTRAKESLGADGDLSKAATVAKYGWREDDS